jgi:hypothetical protein
VSTCSFLNRGLRNGPPARLTQASTWARLPCGSVIRYFSFFTATPYSYEPEELADV